MVVHDDDDDEDDEKGECEATQEEVMMLFALLSYIYCY